MECYIPAPVLLDISKHVQGVMKFFNSEKGFGFVIYESKEYFVHRNWYFQPKAGVCDGSVHQIIFEETDELPTINQKVLFEPVVNEERDSLEARGVVDALKGAMAQRQVKTDFEQAKQLFDTLQVYRVQLIRDILTPQVNNVKKDWDFIKTGEKAVVVFEGNNAAALLETLDKPHVRGTLLQPNTRLLYEIKMNGDWVTCDRPILQAA